MRIEIGNPGSGTTVVIDVTEIAGDLSAVKESVVEGLNVLKTAGDTWVEWSRENETDEQRENRELIERNAELRKRALAAENAQLEEMLAGTTKGIGPVGKI